MFRNIKYSSSFAYAAGTAGTPSASRKRSSAESLEGSFLMMVVISCRKMLALAAGILPECLSFFIAFSKML